MDTRAGFEATEIVLAPFRPQFFCHSASTLQKFVGLLQGFAVPRFAPNPTPYTRGGQWK